MIIIVDTQEGRHPILVRLSMEGRSLRTSAKRVSKHTYGMGCVRPASVRQDNCETKKISWSIKESDFARLMSFPSSSRRERISMMISSCT